MNYKIVSDSSCDLRTLADIDFSAVPLKIATAEHEFTDDASLDIEQMVTYLENANAKSRTSCPNISEWLAAFAGADLIFAVTITGKLSGSYTAASEAKREYESQHPGARVVLLDSLSTGPEMRLLIEHAHDLMLDGCDADTLEHAIQDYSTRTHLLFSLESLKNLANNGRVSRTAARISGLLGIRVVGQASDEGTLELLHKCRGERSTLRKIFEQMIQNCYNGGKVHICHCFNLPAAQALADMIRSAFSAAEITLSPCGGLCSYYAERGGLLIGYEG